MLNRNKKATILIFLVIISLHTISREIPKTKGVDPFFTLVAKCGSPKQFDCLVFFKQQIAKIGINLDIYLLDWPDYVTEVMAYRDFDLVYLSFDNLGNDPFLYGVYSENGSLNAFGYEETLDWDEDLSTGRNEWYIETGLLMTPNNSQERFDFCWEWQHYLLDSILPCLPLFAAKTPNLGDDNLTSVTGKFDILGFNLRETRAHTGGRDPAPMFPEITAGLAIRKAIAYAINREEIKRVVFGDDYDVIDCPIPTSMGNWCNPNIIRYCHAVEVARRYLTVAGYDICYTPDPDYVDPYPDWTDWEAVCSRNNQTIDVAGYDILIALGVLTFFTISFIISKLKNKRKKN